MTWQRACMFYNIKKVWMANAYFCECELSNRSWLYGRLSTHGRQQKLRPSSATCKLIDILMYRSRLRTIISLHVLARLTPHQRPTLNTFNQSYFHHCLVITHNIFHRVEQVFICSSQVAPGVTSNWLMNDESIFRKVGNTIMISPPDTDRGIAILLCK